jgi:glycosyltransferase involved in cell wall biosynthesis
MRIIGIVNKTSGSCYHRVYTPLMLMPFADVHITNKLTEEQLEKGCNALVINRFAFYNQHEEINAWREKYGFKLVIDVDDYWELNSGHILAESWAGNNIPNIIVNNLITADIVTCTHDRLAEYVSKYNKNVHILPNAIPEDFEQFTLNKEKSNKIRIMWQGSITHRADVEILRNPMQRVKGDQFLQEKIKMIFGGHVPKLEDSDAMLSAFSCGLKIDSLIYPGTGPQDYYQIYNNADICLIPLVSNRFNSFKSNLKILEAASAGLPVIASKVNPYLGFPDDCVLYVKSQSDWYKHIKKLVDNEGARMYVGANLKNWCRQHYNFNDINLKRKAIYDGSEQGIY